MPENRRIFGRLTVGENLQHRHLRPAGPAGRRRRTSRRCASASRCSGASTTGQGSKLSGGEQQQLAIARALLARPKLLLLDEPTLGLAPLIVDQVFEILQELHEEGVTILLVEQNAARTIEVADRTYVMRGRPDRSSTERRRSSRSIGDFETAYIGLAGRAS